jgi:hypothetical protein
MVGELNKLFDAIDFPVAASSAVAEWRASRLPHLVFAVPKEEESGGKGSASSGGKGGMKTRGKGRTADGTGDQANKKLKGTVSSSSTVSVKQEPVIAAVAAESKEDKKVEHGKFICAFHLAGLCQVVGERGPMKCDTAKCDRPHIGSLKEVTYAAALASLEQLKGKWVQATKLALETSSKLVPSPFKDA